MYGLFERPLFIDRYLAHFYRKFAPMVFIPFYIPTALGAGTIVLIGLIVLLIAASLGYLLWYQVKKAFSKKKQ